MTLLATFRIEDRMVLLGDMLLSAPGVPSTDDLVDLPAAGSIVGRLGFRIAMGRKLCLVSERLAVGWAGDAALAAEVLEAFETFSTGEDPTEQAVRGILSAFRASPQLRDLKCSLVGCALSHGERFAFRWDSAEADELYVFRSDHARGSGAATLTRLMERARRRGDSTDPVTTAVALTGQLLLAEAKTGESLVAGFGGGYEVIVEDGDRLRVVDSITYLVAVADGKEPVLSPWFLKHGHIGKVVYQARLAETARVEQQICLAVLPSANPFGVPGLARSDISLRSEYYCIIVDAKVGSSTLSMCVAFSGQSPNDVSVESLPDREVLRVREETLRGLVEAATDAAKLVPPEGPITPDGQFLQSDGSSDFSLSPGFSVFAVMHVLVDPSGMGGHIFDCGRVDGVRASLCTAGTKLRFVLQDDAGRPGTVEVDWTPYFGQPGVIMATFDASSGEATIYRGDLVLARAKLRLRPTKPAKGTMTIGTDLTKAKPVNCTIADIAFFSRCLEGEERGSLLEYAKDRYRLGPEASDGRRRGLTT
jgi:hypothetical protein